MESSPTGNQDGVGGLRHQLSVIFSLLLLPHISKCIFVNLCGRGDTLYHSESKKVSHCGMIRAPSIRDELTWSCSSCESFQADSPRPMLPLGVHWQKKHSLLWSTTP